MYFRFGNADGALSVFDQLPQRNDASWNTAISGCVRAGRFTQATELFREMREEGVEPNGFVLASLVTACNRWTDVGVQGIEIHAFVLKVGLMSNVYVGTALLHLYGSRGLVSDARRFFQEMPERNVVSWTALMVSLSGNGYPEEALQAYRNMRKDGVVCNENSFTATISSCGMLAIEMLSLQVVAHIVVSGFETDVSVANSLITLFGNMGRIREAELLFDRMKLRDTISWNSMISMYSREGMSHESFQLFSDMRHFKLRPDATTLSSLISVCASFNHLKWGMGLHALAVKDGLHSFVSVSNTLINMYSMSGEDDDAAFLFCTMPKRDLISWNSMIGSYAQTGDRIAALKILGQLLRANEGANHMTFASALAACSCPEALKDGRVVHALIIHNGLHDNLFLGNALITMYSKCNSMQEADMVFQTMPTIDVISCNALIGGHVENEELMKAMQVFAWMIGSGIKLNYITLVNILGAFLSSHDLLNYGMPFHAHIVSGGFESDEYVNNSLITMYARCGDFKSSSAIFDRTVIKTAVTWNAIIAAKAQHGQGEDALKLLIGMRYDGNKIDQFSLSGGLAASASLASLEEGQQLQSLSIKLGFDSDIHVINAAMDMYSKCGNMDEMLKLLPEPANRPRQSWNILISGYARNGCSEEAEDTFKQMVCIGQKPDYVTFVALLSACNHGGLVHKSLDYFNAMTSEFGISPGIEHCVCMVDLLGRLGRLIEADKFIEDMPILPNDLIWRSLLSSSRTYKNLDVGRKAAKRLLELDPTDDSAYVLLSNLYATTGRWEEVNDLRRHMKSINLKKRPACSWIKLKNEISSFGTGDKTHRLAKQIYAKLEEIMLKVKQVGYVADTSFALHDTDEEQKEQNLWNHSEKLALAYGLMTTPEGSTVRIFKNLRVCGDCHLVFKLVSAVVDRQIVLRDPYRFHHFKGGDCSCSDFW
ncbi:pentatricopeptide repeat-containing protein At2g03880, mitochondrial isoform X1 [Typha angustifolia]|uniref:pentatricopeptide repeat-containing protein At2g03880, mitochondrial isoform X1 n=1 Tax=Typha angustifolia TaxID=59011 RepID=UPI003C302E4D